MTTPTCRQCGWHRWPDDARCSGCDRIAATERAAAEAHLPKPGDLNYTPPTPAEARLHKAALRGRNFGYGGI